MANYYGPDVSHWDGELDWSQAVGIDFIIIAVTAGGVVDSQFEHNYQSATAAGLKVGGYKYSYAMDAESSRSEAQRVVEALNGRKLDMPIFIDMEEVDQEVLGETVIGEIIEAFHDVVVGAGYMFGIYTNYNWYQYLLPEYIKTKYDLWVAHPPDHDDGTEQDEFRPSFGVGWQYSWEAHIEGLPTDSPFDMNVFYKDYDGGGSGSQGEDDGLTVIVTNPSAISLFGRIYHHEDFGTVESLEDLENKATEVLEKNVAESITIEITAFDLSLLNVDYSRIKLGTYVTVYSKPHNLNRMFICSEIRYDLCNPAKTTYILGDLPDSLTDKQIKFARSLSAAGQKSGPIKRELGWHVYDERCHVTSIQFYRSGTGVYLTFTAEILKRIPDSNATIFMLNNSEEEYRPKKVVESTAYLSGTSTTYPLRVKPGTPGDGTGLVQIYNNGDLCSDSERTYVVSGSINWTWTR